MIATKEILFYVFCSLPASENSFLLLFAVSSSSWKMWESWYEMLEEKFPFSSFFSTPRAIVLLCVSICLEAWRKVASSRSFTSYFLGGCCDDDKNVFWRREENGKCFMFVSHIQTLLDIHSVMHHRIFCYSTYYTTSWPWITPWRPAVVMFHYFTLLDVSISICHLRTIDSWWRSATCHLQIFLIVVALLLLSRCVAWVTKT